MEKELTKEQKDKLFELQKSSAFKLSRTGLKYAGLWALSALFLSMVDVFFVQNINFFFISAAVTYVLIFRTIRKEFAVEHDRIKEEIKKILKK